MANYTFEICANSAESCVAAQQGGAQRVELCASMPEGGTTPSYGEIRMARKLIDIRLHVIVRPRGGDFLYSPMELDIMEEDIRMAREAGADGVVFGCLTPEGDVDREAMQKLLKVSEGLSVTFHRAFDYVRNPGSVTGEESCQSDNCDARMRGERNQYRRACRPDGSGGVSFFRARKQAKPDAVAQSGFVDGRDGECG